MAAMNGQQDVQGTLRDMWETRPARPRDDRQIAGVAAAIARRYDIDPVLVRIGFVVAAFYGGIGFRALHRRLGAAARRRSGRRQDDPAGRLAGPSRTRCCWCC